MHYELHWFSKAGHRESIAITQEQFVRARKARQVLEESTNIERRLDIFLRNYADLEIEVAKGTIELTLRQQLWVDPLLPSHDVDRRLMNLLESASGYRWQVSTSVHRAEQKNYRDLFEERRKHSFAYTASLKLYETIHNTELCPYMAFG